MKYFIWYGLKHIHVNKLHILFWYFKKIIVIGVSLGPCLKLGHKCGGQIFCTNLITLFGIKCINSKSEWGLFEPWPFRSKAVPLNEDFTVNLITNGKWDVYKIFFVLSAVTT